MVMLVDPKINHPFLISSATKSLAFSFKHVELSNASDYL